MKPMIYSSQSTEDVVVWTRCSSDALFGALASFGASASLKMVRITNDILENPSLPSPAAVLWILDEEQDALTTALYHRLRSVHQTVDVALVTFDESLDLRQTTYFQELSALGIRTHVLTYLHVLFPSLYQPSPVMESILTKALGEHTHPISGMVYPLWYEDCGRHLIEMLFRLQGSDGVYRGRESLSALECVHALADLLSKEEVALIDQGSGMRIPPAPQAVEIPSRDLTEIFALIASLHLEKDIPLVSSVVQNAAQRPITSPRTTPRPRRRFFGKWRVRALIALFIFTLVYGGILLGSLTVFSLVKKQYMQAFSALSPSSTAILSPSITSQMTVAMWLGKWVPFALPASGSALSADEMERIMKFGLLVVDAARANAQARMLGYALYRGIATTGVEQEKHINALLDAEDDVYRLFSLLQVRFPQVSEALRVFGVVNDRFSPALLSSIREEIIQARSLAEHFPTLFGFDAKKTYAIVFLNDEQIRGSGGVVEMVGILTFTSGKLSGPELYSAQELSKKITGIVDPPQEIAKFLPGNTWAIQDAAWSGSTTQAGSQIAWFLEKQGMGSIDGVVFLPSSSLQRLAGYLNLDAKTPFPEFLEKLLQADELQFPQLVDAISSELSTRHMGVTTKNQSLLQTVQALSWGQELAIPPCPSVFTSGSCQVQGVYVVENALSPSPLERPVLRSYAHTITIVPGSLLQERAITITNPNTSFYSTLLTVYVDPQANITEVLVNEQSIPAQDVSFGKEEGRVKVTFPLSVVGGTANTARIRYSTPGIPESQSSLVFVEQRQIGIGDDPFRLTIRFPENYIPKTVAPRPQEVTNRELTYDLIREKNLLIGVGF